MAVDVLSPGMGHLNRTGDREAPGVGGGLCPLTDADEAFIAQARAEAAERGYRISLSGVRRLYRRHLLAVERGDFLPWLLTYCDRTGEDAVHNVVRGGGR